MSNNQLRSDREALERFREHHPELKSVEAIALFFIAKYIVSGFNANCKPQLESAAKF